jgi:hypothetical protein
MNNKTDIRLLPAILAILALNACSNAVEGTNQPKNPNAKIDKLAPTWAVTPSNNGLLPATDAITIVFSESMDISSFTVTNDLANEVAQAQWSTTTHENDTLVLSPTTQWSDGLQRYIRVEATDKAGNAPAPILLSFDVDTTPPRVSANPDDVLSNTPLNVTLTCDDGQGTGCDAIYYTVDETIPTTDSLLYSGPVRIDRTTKIKFIGVDNAGVISNYSIGWYEIDLEPPNGNVAPVPNQIIGSHNDIDIQFSESMNTNSLALSGTMASEVGVIEWFTVNTSNDFLRLHPVSGSNWSLRIDATLTIAAQDIAGNATDINLTYDIGTIHVSADDVNASDTNPGTRALPMQTIQAGISTAATLAGPSQVLVAQGNYSASVLNATGISLVKGVSLFGGYAPDWSTRDINAYASAINAGNLPALPVYVPANEIAWVISGSGSITRGTSVDGFVINAGNGNSPTGLTSAVYIENSANPTIIRNVINVGAVDGKTYGVYVENASPMLVHNTINGATNPAAPLANDSTAIYVANGAHPDIRKNTINGGYATTTAKGIYLTNASATIEKNDINGGNANTVQGIDSVNSSMDVFNNVLINYEAQQDSYGISNSAGSANRVYNNIIDSGELSLNATGIYVQGAASLDIKNNIITNGNCIYEADLVSDPLMVENNDLFNCQIAYYDADAGCIKDSDGDGIFSSCSVDDLNLLTDITAANNLADDPVFKDPKNLDYHFTQTGTQTSPLSVIEGALDLTAFCPCDKDEATRTVPWSIGAYEMDALVGILQNP